MSYKGTPQLTKLVVNYCAASGSSRGVRAFLKDLAPALTQTHPNLVISEQMRPGKHPILEAEYATNRSKQICVKNVDAQTTLARVLELKHQTGWPATKWGNGKWTKTPSIQGEWNAWTDYGTREVRDLALAARNVGKKNKGSAEQDLFADIDKLPRKFRREIQAALKESGATADSVQEFDGTNLNVYPKGEEALQKSA
eukprot:GFYU01003249.1.p2 GENE.GFYU01003249.1~~GFYU01003249.1.p2  ORF type:complete len:198 (-),score=35.20 GFYU01003249.1:361-954(-)